MSLLYISNIGYNDVPDQVFDPVVLNGLTASGSGSNDFSGSTGTFKTSTGANQLSGAATVTDATTPSLTLDTGKTNTGSFIVKGKTSGALAITTADATAQTLTVSAAAQTVGAATITIPNLASVSDTLVFTTLQQSLASKTLVSPVISTGLTASGSAANDFSASTGTFKTSTGAVTLGNGAISVSGIATFSAAPVIASVSPTATGTGGMDLSGGSGTFKTSTGAVTIGPGAVGITGAATLVAGSTSIAPLSFSGSSSLLTAQTAGAIETDNVNTYITNETTAGRGRIPIKQYFALTSDGGTISTIANFFGTTSNIPLVSGGFYYIEVTAWFTNSADTNTMTWTLVNSSTPTAQNIYYEMSPAAGIVAPPGTATALVGQFLKDATATKAFSTGALGSAATYYARFRIWLKNGTGTSLKIQATKNTGGTITPNLGSFWTCERLPSANVGTFAA